MKHHTTKKSNLHDTPFRRLKDAKTHAIGEIGDYVDHYWKAGQREGSAKQKELNQLIQEVDSAKTIQKVKGIEKKLKNKYRKY